MTSLHACVALQSPDFGGSTVKLLHCKIFLLNYTLLHINVMQ